MATPTPTSASSIGLTPEQSTSLSSASSVSLASSLSSAFASLASQSQALVSQSAVATGQGETSTSYKIIGVVLALTSGLFIGSSFVFKKKGLLSAQKKVLAAGGQAGESHAYLKSPMWITGMTLMIIGEICNFVAYAFADAVLVTPMGALSVVICAILSSIFLKETLTFFGKIGCFLCIVGATIIALNGPQEQAVSTIKEFQALFLAPAFLVFGSVIIITALVLIFWFGPRYGKKNMLVYISVCSLIGGLSVVATQGLGSSIVTSIKGDNQFKFWFIYFVLGFTVCTLLTEINYLNKALELFNTALVTPTYYVMFTFCTLVTSVVLFQGLKAPPIDIITLVLGFLVICSGITLLQMSKVDPTEIKGLDRRTTVLLQAVDRRTEDEKGLDVEDPGMDGLRGLGGVMGSIHRVRSARKSMLHPQELAERSEMRRRRRETLLSQSTTFSRDVEMGEDGLKRHQLYDAPMPTDAMDQISARSQDIAMAHEAQPISPNRGRGNTIRFNADEVQGHDHKPIIPPQRSGSFPNVQPFSAPRSTSSLTAYDAGPSIRLTHPIGSGSFLSLGDTAYRDPYASVGEHGPKSAPPYAIGGRPTSRDRSDTQDTSHSNRSWNKRLPLSPRSISHRKLTGDSEEERGLVGSRAHSSGEPRESESASESEEGGNEMRSAGSSGSEAGYAMTPVVHRQP